TETHALDIAFKENLERVHHRPDVNSGGSFLASRNRATKLSRTVFSLEVGRAEAVCLTTSQKSIAAALGPFLVTLKSREVATDPPNEYGGCKKESVAELRRRARFRQRFGRGNQTRII